MTDNSDRFDRMAAGYGAPAPDSPAEQKAARKARQLAESFTHDERQEALLKMRDAGDPRYDAMPPEIKVSLGYYMRAKAAAKEFDR